MKYNFIIFFLLLKLVLFIFCKQSLQAVDKTKLCGFLWKLPALALPPMFESIFHRHCSWGRSVVARWMGCFWLLSFAAACTHSDPLLGKLGNESTIDERRKKNRVQTNLKSSHTLVSSKL